MRFIKERKNMSRSNPVDTRPNPAVRWFEWSGKTGQLQYWDKDLDNPKTQKKGMRVNVRDGFKFLVLDELSCVRGYSKQIGGIYSNEVRDSRSEVMVVKSYKGDVITSGFYKDIKDHVTSKAVGGHFYNSIYIGFFPDPKVPVLKIGGLHIKGSSVNAWIEFKKAHRRGSSHPQGEVYERAVVIAKGDTIVNGDVTYILPKFSMVDIKPETDAMAKVCDAELAVFLEGYFAKTKSSAAQPTDDGQAQPEAPENEPPPSEPQGEAAEPEPEDVPF